MHTNSNLEELSLQVNNGDEAAYIFAIALANNRKMKTLDLSNNGVTAEGYSSFSKVLCDVILPASTAHFCQITHLSV